MPISWRDVDWRNVGRRDDGYTVTSSKGATLPRRRHKMADKPFVHELKAHDFDLIQWHPIDECPKDGRQFVVKTADGMMHLALWQDGKIIVQGGDSALGEVVEWRSL